MVADSLQVAGITFLKFQAAETCLRGSFVSGFNEVSGDVDSNYFSPQNGPAEAPSCRLRSRGPTPGAAALSRET